MFGYVWITFVVSFLQFLLWDYTFGYVSCDSCVKTDDTLQIIKQTSKIVGSCLRPFVGALLAIGSSTGLSITFGYVWDTFLLRLRAPIEFLELRSHKNPHQTRRIPLELFGIRLAYVSCNSIAIRQFEQTNLYVSIRLVQPFHRFVSGPLRFYTFRATLPLLLKDSLRFYTFPLRFITFVQHFYMFW